MYLSLKILRMRSRDDRQTASPPAVGVAVADKPDYGSLGALAVLSVVRVGVVGEVGPGRLTVELRQGLIGQRLRSPLNIPVAEQRQSITVKTIPDMFSTEQQRQSRS